MKNFLQPGDTLDLIAPAGGVVSGDAVLVGTSLLVVATATRAATEIFAGKKKGVFTLPKLVTDVMAEGGKVNWNNGNKEFQNATTTLDNAATVVEAAGNGDTTVKVVMTPV